MSKVKLPNPVLYKLGKWFWSGPVVRKMGVTFYRQELKGVKPPMLVLANHSSIRDYHIVGNALYPLRCNFVAAVNTAAGKQSIFDAMGVLTKRQFSVSVSLIKDIKSLLAKRACVVIYPEARLSADGRLAEFNEGIVKLIKLCGVTVVGVKVEGAYLSHNKCTNTVRRCPVDCTVSVIATAEQVKSLSKEELHTAIKQALTYDDYEYARRKNIILERPTFALDKILYRCPVCGKEYTITSDDDKLTCSNCNAVFNADQHGGLHCDGSDIDSVARWFDYQREKIAEELVDGYVYCTRCAMSVYNGEGYTPQGEWQFIQQASGFTLTQGEKTISIDGKHYDALPYDPAECFYLSTDEATYKLQPIDNPREATKIALTQEELYKKAKKNL